MAEDKNTPFAVRMDVEDKAKLLKLIEESGSDSNKEFMNTLMSAYELNKVKVEIPEASESIKRVEELTQLINDSFVNMGKQIKISKESMNLQFEKDTEVYTKRIDGLKEENETLDKKVDYLTSVYNKTSENLNESTQTITRLEDQIEQLNKNLKDKDVIIEEFKEKNDTLTGLLNEYKDYKNKIEDMKKELQESQALNMSQATENELKDRQLTDLQKELDREKEIHGTVTEDLKIKHTEELEREREKAAFEKDKALLDQERKHQDILNSMRDKYNDKVRALLEELEHNNKNRNNHTPNNKTQTSKNNNNNNKSKIEKNNKETKDTTATK